MKILFLNPPAANARKIIRTFDCGTESKGNYLYQPYDFLALSARVPRHAKLTFIDGVADRMSSAAFQAATRVNEADVCVLAMSDCVWGEDLRSLQALRAANPRARILVFGDSFLDPAARHEVLHWADGIITNPFLFDFSELGQRETGERLYPVPIGKYARAKTELSIGMPRHDLFMNRAYRWPFSSHFRYTSLFTTWGCPYSCEHCVVRPYPYLVRSHEEVLEEMKLIRNLGIRELYFADRSFGFSRERTGRLLEAALSLNLRFSWSAYFHPNCYDPELLRLFKRSGCHTLLVGIEAPQQELLRPFGRHVSEARLSSLLMHARELGIELCGDFLIGLPKQTRADVLQLIEYSRTCGIDYASFNILTPLPGTRVRSDAIAEGRVPPRAVHYDSLGSGNVLGSDQLSAKEILELKSHAVRSFYFRPSYWLRRAARVRGLEHLFIQLQEMLSLILKNQAKKPNVDPGSAQVKGGVAL